MTKLFFLVNRLVGLLGFDTAVVAWKVCKIQHNKMNSLNILASISITFVDDVIFLCDLPLLQKNLQMLLTLSYDSPLKL